MVSSLKPADWTAIHQRMAAIQQRLDRSWTPTAEEMRKTLEARARAMAQEPLRPSSGTNRFDVVEFLLAYEKYGIETSCVREIYPLVELTPLPGTPPFVMGIANVRGQILSIIDIKVFFDLPVKGLTDLNKVIIVRYRDIQVGILADDLVGVRTLGMEELQAPVPTLTGIRAEFLRGLTEDRLAILDVERILSDNRMVVGRQVQNGE